jgi:hypothetical protein
VEFTGLVDNFGSALLEYVCAAEPGAFPKTAWEAQFPESRPALGPRQQEVLDRLEQMDPPAGQPRIVIPSSMVVTIEPETGHVVANVLRLHAGGELPDISSDDPVLAPLLAIAVECFPSFLITNEQIQRAGPGCSSFGTWASDVTEGVDVVFDRHPCRDEALAAIDADPELSALFGEQIDHEIRGRAHDALNMAGALLQAAALSLLASSDDLSVTGLVAETKRQVEETRRLGRGEAVEGSVLVGLFGISLSDDVASVDLPWGTLTTPKDASADDRA